jgi:hypothetical protein
VLYFYMHTLELCYKNLSLFKTSSLPMLIEIFYVSQKMERQAAEITPETCGELYHWLDRALLRLGVPPTYVTYRAEYMPAVTGQLVLCTVAVLPHSALPGFKGGGLLQHRLDRPDCDGPRLPPDTGLPSHSVPRHI